MAHLIVACARRPADAAGLAASVRLCSGLLTPEETRIRPPLVREETSSTVAVVNPTDGMPTHEGGVCLGQFFGGQGRWWEIGSAPPDGTYALVRQDEATLELVADVLATRPVWFVRTEDFFLAATSQRVLVALLGSYSPNRRAATWMLASGYLGGEPWDARLRRLRGDSRLVLDRHTWTTRVECQSTLRDPLALTDEEHIDRLRDAIFETCADLDLPMDEWLLPLSGGLDSRTILMGLLHAGKQPRCVTWGLPSSLEEPMSDAVIAGRLASALNVQHRFCPVDLSCTTLDAAMRRFLLASEGQVSDFGGYADGLAVWRAFCEEGEAGVVRGDEPGLEYFNFRGRLVSELQIRRMHSWNLLSDFPEGHPIRHLGLAQQETDGGLERRDDETLCAWNNRLYEEFLFPSQLAPLNTLKSSYVEIVSPLLSRRVLEVARRLPDHLRVGREPLRRLLAPISPDIPHASVDAHPLPKLFPPLSFDAAMLQSFSSTEAMLMFEQPALDLIAAALTASRDQSPHITSLKPLVKAVIPKDIIRRAHPVWPLGLTPRTLALRTFFVTETARTLTRDADFGARWSREAAAKGGQLQ